MPSYLPQSEIRDTDLRKMEAAIWRNFGRLRYIAKPVDYSATTDIDAIFCSNTVTVTLPQAKGNGGKVFYVRNIGAGTVVIQSEGQGEKIDLTATKTLAANAATTLISDNNNWYSF